jgi:hypothetical protein
MLPSVCLSSLSPMKCAVAMHMIIFYLSLVAISTRKLDHTDSMEFIIMILSVFLLAIIPNGDTNSFSFSIRVNITSVGGSVCLINALLVCNELESLLNSTEFTLKEMPSIMSVSNQQYSLRLHCQPIVSSLNTCAQCLHNVR